MRTPHTAGKLALRQVADVARVADRSRYLDVSGAGLGGGFRDKERWQVGPSAVPGARTSFSGSMVSEDVRNCTSLRVSRTAGPSRSGDAIALGPIA